MESHKSIFKDFIDISVPSCLLRYLPVCCPMNVCTLENCNAMNKTLANSNNASSVHNSIFRAFLIPLLLSNIHAN